MELYDININALKEFKANFYKENKDIFEEERESECGAEFLEAKDGSVYMQYSKEGKSTRLNSSYSPTKEAIKWVERFEFSGYSPAVILFGIGCGHFARALMDKLNNESSIILFEPLEDVFVSILKNVDISDIIKDDRVVLLVGEKGYKSLFTTVASHVHWSTVQNMRVINHPGYDVVFEEEASRFIDSVNEVISAIVIEGNTESYFGRQISHNTVNNLVYLPNSHYFVDFVKLFDEDTVGIVVAAGPSLDSNIHVLHQIKEKAVIIATDTSLRRLHAENIVPDFVVSVDPHKPISLFQNVGFESIPFFCKIDGNKDALAIHTGDKIWINPSEFHRRLYAILGVEAESINSGGSVATMAFAICNMLGLKNIVLIGQDLAYKGDATHAGGWDNRIKDEDKTIEYVKGNYEEKVKTRGDWVYYIKWYERAIRDLISDDVTVINATEGGAYIEGTKLMTLQEVADTLCTEDRHITEKIQSVLAKQHDDYSEKTNEFVRECISDLKTMIRQFDKGITLCNRFDRKYSKSKTMDNEVVKTLNDISKVNGKIGDMPVYWLVDEIIKTDDKQSISNIYAAEEDEYTTNINMIKNTKHIFELTKAAAKELLPEFEKTIEILESK